MASGRKYQLVTCADAKFLSHALSTFNDAPILVTSLDKVEDTLPHLGSTNGEKRYWIVVPSTVADDAMTIPPALTSRVEEKGYKLITWASFLYAGRLLPKDADADAEEGTQPSDPAQVHSVVLLARAAGSLMGTDDPQVLTITNSNLTAGVTAILSLFPASHRPSSSRGGKAKDVFLTSVDPAQPFGLGIIMSALYVGADLVFIPPSEALDGGAGLPPNCPSPTVAFLSKRQLRTLTSTLAHKAKASALYPIARRQAQARLREGSVARAGGWADWAVWRAARAAGATQRLRAVVVTDGTCSKISPSPSYLPHSRATSDLVLRPFGVNMECVEVGNGMSPNEVEDTFVHLAVPVMRTWTSGAATAPLTATHFFDFQLVPRVSGRAGASAGSGKQQATDKDEGRDRGENGVGNEGEGTMHVGPPGMNIEIEVRGPTIDVSLERGADPRGTVHVRGPTVLRQFESGFAGEEKGNKRDDAEWEGLEVEAVVRPNGTFVVL
ncbi:hypothetical protein QFC19_000648 [Naganishia cerealis]|uniref:Uncharacterized protein n=1 Tax=Naganishia cerealis TaxID=610337 RepID=A0ACC2WLL1_9TREE|nr:hypothetical protein QFC19_000648 [Naganishia cerealis]